MTISFLPSAAPVDASEDARCLGYPDQRKVLRDARGALYVCYRKKHKAGKTSYRIFVARSANNGASWQPLGNAPIEAVGVYNQRVPAICADERGRLHVAWYGNDAANSGEHERQIKYARCDDGARWQPWVNVAPVTGYAGQTLWQEHPVIAARGDAVWMAWQGLDAENATSSQVKLARSTNNGRSWGAWANVQPGAGNRSRPTLLLGDTKAYILAYGNVGGTQQIVATASADGGDTWEAWRPVAPAPADQRHVSAALDAAQRLHAVWRQGASAGPAQVYYAMCAGGRWGNAQAVAPDVAAWQLFPSVAAAPNGALWAVWTESDAPASFPSDAPTAGRVVATYRSPGGAWQPPVPIATGIYASLGAATTEGVDVVWQQPAGERQLIRHGVLAL